MFSGYGVQGLGQPVVTFDNTDDYYKLDGIKLESIHFNARIGNHEDVDSLIDVLRVIKYGLKQKV